ncbi:2Fe-2S iron-sulfur cluster-binding protein [Halioxenophilus aromaticivorans]|uniref:2Fe-2S iron-sulfur cluster-binding protein n=1 Tax=Halioxenophilus aromaticivorans TaxID=1306992 RepID=UPI0031EE804D
MSSDGSSIIRVIRAGEEVEFPALVGETILFSARSSGVTLPSSCKVGICATCIARLIVGEVVMRNNQALTPQEQADGLVLACQSVPQTPLVILEY